MTFNIVEEGMSDNDLNQRMSGCIVELSDGIAMIDSVHKEKVTYLLKTNERSRGSVKEHTLKTFMQKGEKWRPIPASTLVLFRNHLSLIRQTPTRQYKVGMSRNNTSIVSMAGDMSGTRITSNDLFTLCAWYRFSRPAIRPTMFASLLEHRESFKPLLYLSDNFWVRNNIEHKYPELMYQNVCVGNLRSKTKVKVNNSNLLKLVETLDREQIPLELTA